MTSEENQKNQKILENTICYNSKKIHFCAAFVKAFAAA
jgi:hypothetical protein